MKKHLLFSIVLSFLALSCTKTTTAPVTAPSVGQSETIEGTVFYFVGGGTVEMPYPAGYRLLYAHWVTQSPDSSAGPVYLNGIVDSSFVNKHVRVTGLTEVDSAHGTAPGYTYSWVKITVQSMQVIP
jgi:hypothetical protein